LDMGRCGKLQNWLLAMLALHNLGCVFERLAGRKSSGNLGIDRVHKRRGWSCSAVFLLFQCTFDFVIEPVAWSSLLWQRGSESDLDRLLIVGSEELIVNTGVYETAFGGSR